MASAVAVISNAALLAVALTVGASAYAQAQKPVTRTIDHPIVGTWQWTRAANNCTEVYRFRSDGTATITSGAERSDDTFEISSTPEGRDRYRLAITTLKDYGRQDCVGSEVDSTGKTATGYVGFTAARDSMILCADATSDRCIGPMRRVGP